MKQVIVKGAKFYNIEELTKHNLSNIAILELEKLGYTNVYNLYNGIENY